MRLICLFILMCYSVATSAQANGVDTVKIKLIALDKEPLRGATLYVKGSNPPYGVISDFNGEAEMIMKERNSIIELSFIGPYVAFKVNQPVDSISVNLERKRALYFYKNKKVKKVRLKISGY
ncbi:hypothetical protein EYV94_10930 [Puteibacter caeruleilacunae]|nr:hypothetical protein EYV94_10930 [Puteibacter caeruleilacunae]